MSVDLVVAARAGDASAFARIVEHWDGHLRPFVHLTLGADGATDRVLSAAYLRAYRALPRYKADRTPGLWLHRVAYLAVLDEVRRSSRDPLRVKEPVPALPVPDALADPGDAASAALRRLATDQRAMAVMVDLEHFRQEAVADVFDTGVGVVRARLGGARRTLAGKVTDDGGPKQGDDDQAQLAPAAVEALRSIPIPEPGPTFWSDLGRRLLAERSQPASPTPDPLARLNPTPPSHPPHPAEPGFKPDQAVSTSVAEMADLADRTRPGRPWGRYALVVLAVLVVAGLITAAVRLGTSERTPDGSVAGPTLAGTVEGALAIDGALTVRARVQNRSAGGVASAPIPYDLVLGEDGSWSVNRTDTLDRRVYDATTGTATKLVLGTGATPTVTASIDAGLATGAPDPAAVAPSVLADLQAIAPFLRADPDGRAPRTRVGDTGTWTLTRTVPSGADGSDETWRVAVRRRDGVPLQLEKEVDGTVVRTVRFSDWSHATEVPEGAFEAVVPEGIVPTITNGGFATGDLPAAKDLGRGEAITPSWLPDGFALTTVTTRATAPDGATSTADGTNPADVDVLSLGFQRGPERITVTMRDVGKDPNAWKDPFATLGPGAQVENRTVGDGHYNGVPVTIETDAAGRARLWGVGTDAVFTVSGDLTADEAFRLTSSLR